MESSSASSMASSSASSMASSSASSMALLAVLLLLRRRSRRVWPALVWSRRSRVPGKDGRRKACTLLSHPSWTRWKRRCHLRPVQNGWSVEILRTPPGSIVENFWSFPPNGPSLRGKRPCWRGGGLRENPLTGQLLAVSWLSIDRYLTTRFDGFIQFRHF